MHIITYSCVVYYFNEFMSLMPLKTIYYVNGNSFRVNIDWGRSSSSRLTPTFWPFHPMGLFPPPFLVSNHESSFNTPHSRNFLISFIYVCVYIGESKMEKKVCFFYKMDQFSVVEESFFSLLRLMLFFEKLF